MVSSIPYKSFKDLDLKNKKSFGILVTAVFIFMVVAYNPGVMMFVVMMLYILSGPLLLPWSLKKLALQNNVQTQSKQTLKLIEKDAQNV